MEKPRKENVVLDLDNTLICSETTSDFPFDKEGMREKALLFTIHDMDGYYVVFERPYTQQFLDYLFKNYNVSVWTAASKDYALFIIKNVVLKDPKRRLQYILFSEHCKVSKRLYDATKQQKMFWEKYGLDMFDDKNTIIIDDYDEVYNSQPDRCIMIKAFNFFDDGSEKDNELKKMPDQIKAKFLALQNAS